MKAMNMTTDLSEKRKIVDKIVINNRTKANKSVLEAFTNMPHEMTKNNRVESLKKRSSTDHTGNYSPFGSF